MLLFTPVWYCLLVSATLALPQPAPSPSSSTSSSQSSPTSTAPLGSEESGPIARVSSKRVVGEDRASVSSSIEFDGPIIPDQAFAVLDNQSLDVDPLVSSLSSSRQINGDISSLSSASTHQLSSEEERGVARVRNDDVVIVDQNGRPIGVQRSGRSINRIGNGVRGDIRDDIRINGGRGIDGGRGVRSVGRNEIIRMMLRLMDEVRTVNRQLDNIEGARRSDNIGLNDSQRDLLRVDDDFKRAIRRIAN